MDSTKNKVYIFVGQESYVEDKRIVSVEVCNDPNSQWYGDIVAVGHKELDWMCYKNFDCVNAIITEQGNEFVPLPYDSGDKSQDSLVM